MKHLFYDKKKLIKEIRDNFHKLEDCYENYSNWHYIDTYSDDEVVLMCLAKANNSLKCEIAQKELLRSNYEKQVD